MNDSFDPTKPYCGVCAAQDVALRRLHNGADDPAHVCRDRKACRARVAARQKGGQA